MDALDIVALAVSLLLLVGLVVMILAAVFDVARTAIREGAKPNPRG